MSPMLFNIYIDHIVREAMSRMGGGVHIEHRDDGALGYRQNDKPDGTMHLQIIMYADDMALLAQTPADLQNMLCALDEACEKYGMEISTEKTKVLMMGPQEVPVNITLRGAT